MRAVDVADAREKAWRLNVQDFAEVASDGHWQSFLWLDFMLERVQAALTEGDARVILNAPPRHGKSESISHWLPAWFLDWYPTKNVILASYSDSYASRWGLAVRDEFTKGKQTWTRVRPDKSAANDWQTLLGGGMRSVGVGGSITGVGGDLIIVDDPHKDWAEAMSASARKKVINWFEGTIYPRREPGASIILIQTRWHEDDLTGYLLRESEDKWMHFRFPAFAEDGDILGRKPGEVLCPERFAADELEVIQRTLGSKFAGLYQQRPAPLQGNMVKRDWFGRWTPESLPEEGRTLISLDPTFKATGSSYIVAQVWRDCYPDFYLLDQVRDRMSFLDCCSMILRLTEKWPAVSEVLVEAAANGEAISDSLKKYVPGIIPIRAETSKENRLAAVSPSIESGNVFIPADAVWVDDFVDEVVTFPNAAHDDQVDAMTMALARMSVRKKVERFDFEIPMTGVRTSPWKEI